MYCRTYIRMYIYVHMSKRVCIVDCVMRTMCFYNDCCSSELPVLFFVGMCSSLQIADQNNRIQIYIYMHIYEFKFDNKELKMFRQMYLST